MCQEALVQSEAACSLPCLLFLTSLEGLFAVFSPIDEVASCTQALSTPSEPSAARYLTPSQNPQLIGPETQSQRLICPDLTKKKERGPLLWWCQVLLPVGPECSNKISISSFLGQHSSEWRSDFPSNCFRVSPQFCSLSIPLPEGTVFKVPGAQSQHLNRYSIPTTQIPVYSIVTQRGNGQISPASGGYFRFIEILFLCDLYCQGNVLGKSPSALLDVLSTLVSRRN